MIKRKEINLTPRATEDLENLWFYSQEQFGLLKADEYIGRISDIFELIATHEVGIKRPELGDSLYSLPVEKHVVFFLVSELVIKLSVSSISPRMCPGICSGTNFIPSYDS